MIDKDEIARRFGQSAVSYDSSAIAQRRAVDMLVEHLAPCIKSGASVFEVGCGTGILTASVIRTFKPHIYIANDISGDMLAQLRLSASDNMLSTLQGDAEAIEWPSQQNVVVSASAVQWFDSPLSFVGKSALSIADGGVVGLATYGPETFCELQQLGVSGLHYPRIDEWKDEIASNGLRLLSSEVETVKLHYKSALAMMQDLQRAGVTASEQKMSASQMRNLLRNYDTHFMADGQVPLTYEIYVLVFGKC